MTGMEAVGPDRTHYNINISYHQAEDGAGAGSYSVMLAMDNVSMEGNLTEGNFTIMILNFEGRFVPYTVLATASFLFNMLSLMALTNVHGHRSVHHVLLQNLAVCDMVGAALLWMYYNSPYLFPKFDIQRVEHCMFIALVLVAPFLLSLCTSCLSLLQLALNQYIAICNPLFSATRISRGTACCCIIASWLLALSLAVIPAFLMLFMTRFEHCASYAVDMGTKAIEIGAYVLTGLIVLIVALYGRVYREVLEYRKRMPNLQARPSCNHVRSGDNIALGRRTDTERNFKAFITTFLLSGTLVIFWLPYMVLNFVSVFLNFDNIPDVILYVKFYVIDFLPMLNFMTDPIIYGIRMREIRAGYKRLFSKLFPCCVRDTSRQFTRSSVRFSTLDTSL